MAHGTQEFDLVGYSECLERRPLKFVDPIPASRICSACGNIPRLTYTLVCGHTFCQPCYECCTTTSECVCPLDGDACNRDNVTSKEYPAEQLLRRKVHCWNEANGCSVVLPASQIAEHVRLDCKHHLSRCPKCSADVLSRDMSAHLKSGCRALMLHAAPEALPGSDNKEYADLLALNRQVEQRVRELDARIAILSLESGSHIDKLVEVCHSINCFKEALAEKFERASAEITDRLDRNEGELKALAAHGKTIEERVAQLSFDRGSQSDKLVDVLQHINNLKDALTHQFGPASARNVAEIKVLHTEKSEALMTAIHSVLTSVPSDPRTHQWVLKGYAALKEKALKDGSSLSNSDKVCLRRYLMTWGIDVIKDGESVNLQLRIQLHEGTEDEFLEWPFTKKLKLSIIHPETRQELHRVGTPGMSEYCRDCYCRPIESSNTPVRFPETKIELGDIEMGGYIKLDQLLLRLEVLL